MKLSYTNTNDFQICKSRFFHKHVAKDVEYESTPQMEYGNYVHKAFEDRLNAGRVFPDALASCEPFVHAIEQVPGVKVLVEHRLGIRADGSPCDFYDEDCFWCAKIDVVLFNATTCLIFDWKTGKERENPFELRVQAALFYAAHPEIQVFKGRYVWLKNNKVGELHNLSDVHRTWMEMKTIDTLIRRSAETNYWPESEGPLCAWCNVYQCRFNKNDKEKHLG